MTWIKQKTFKLKPYDFLIIIICFLVNDLTRYISLTTKATRRETDEHTRFNIISKH